MKKKSLTGLLLSLSLTAFFAPGVQAADHERRVMILPFRNLTQQAADNWLRDSFSESLLMGLGRVKSLQLVERAELAQVIKEQAFMQTLMADPDKAPQIGKLVGADYMVTGSFQKVGSRIQVNARLIRVQTGEIDASTLTQVQGSFEQLFELQQNLADQLVDKLQVERKADEIQKMKSSIAATRSTKAQEYYLKAKEREDFLVGEQTLSEAIQNYRAAIQEDPNYALAWAGLAESLASRAQLKGQWSQTNHQEDGPEALRCADQALKLQPDLSVAWRARAKALNALNRNEEALADAKKSVEIENSSKNIIWYLGLRHPDFNKFSPSMFESMQAEMKELGADFDDPLIKMTLASQYVYKFIAEPSTDLSPAFRLLEQALEKRPDNVPVLMLLSSFNLIKGDLPAAKKYLERIEAIDPDNPILLYLSANSLRFIDKDKALAQCLKALKLQPNLIYARILLMEIYQQQFKDIPAFEATFKLAREEAPLNGHVYQTAGTVYLRLKRYDEAIQEFELAEKYHLLTDTSEAKISYGIVLKLKADTYKRANQLDLAYQTYQAVIANQAIMDLTRAFAQREMADILYQKNDFSGALVHFTAFMQGAPGYAKDNEILANYRLLYLLAQEQKGQGSAAVYNDIGQNFLILGNREKALSYLQKALALEPQNAVVHYNLGVYYQKSNQIDKARSEFSRALALKPDYAKAQEALKDLKP